MTHDLQTWVIVLSLALLASVMLQIFFMGILLRLLRALRPRPGQCGLWDLTDRALVALNDADRATRTTVEILEQIKPVVEQAASISRRQLSHADQVVEEFLTGVERIERDVNTVRNWPVREARAWSAGFTSAITAFFRMNGTAAKGKRW
jgi:hypothetical protein